MFETMCISLWFPSPSFLSLSAQCPVGRVWHDAWSHVALEINALARSLSRTKSAGQDPVTVRWHRHTITNSASQNRELVSAGNASAQDKSLHSSSDFMGSWMAKLFMLFFQQKKAYWKRTESVAQCTNSSALMTLFMVPLTTVNFPESLLWSMNFSTALWRSLFTPSQLSVESFYLETQITREKAIN